MSKHGTEKVRKIRAIPDRQMDFYRRIRNSPEQQKKRKNRKIATGLVLAAIVAATAVVGVLKYQEVQYENENARLEAFLEDETNIAAADEAKELEKQVQKQANKLSDMQNAKANIDSYPLVTSQVFKTLEDCCPDKVSITITGYNSSTGELQFDAVASKVTDVSEVIEVWKTLDIFQSVYFTGYTQDNAQDGYTVKVVCILSENAGRDDESKEETSESVEEMSIGAEETSESAEETSAEGQAADEN